MNNQEIRRKILAMLLQATTADDPSLIDTDIAGELGIGVRIVQGNLQILKEAGYVDLYTPDFLVGAAELLLFASLSPKGEVLLSEASSSNPMVEATERESERAHVLDLIAVHTKRLRVLEIQAAHYSPSACPAHVLIDIDEVQTTLQQLREQEALLS